ncbi:hypothetical protein Bca52824_045421 [Brassica carinata]|uniref:F-box associated beta-propeller type 3 domain-containing protein n=1 Tax=Brassica carinata TaxID=52824 RepID=A0A8X7RD48_BRACI|nr:hypothetical protein Bca52824_045421 [Brassica carinata]
MWKGICNIKKGCASQPAVSGDSDDDSGAHDTAAGPEAAEDSDDGSNNMNFSDEEEGENLKTVKDGIRDVTQDAMFWEAPTASGFLGLAISFTSMWFLYQTGPTTYSLGVSFIKVPISLSGLVLFDVPLSLPNLFSIHFEPKCHNRVSKSKYNSLQNLRTDGVSFHKSCFRAMHESTTLVNYDGKLGLIMLEDSSNVTRSSKSFDLWVLQDDEWSKHVYVLPPSCKDMVTETMHVYFWNGGTSEIVLSPRFQYVPFLCHVLQCREQDDQKSRNPRTGSISG